jgi:pimeloyl-ACP methyl ester carboxylesterase
MAGVGLAVTLLVAAVGAQNTRPREHFKNATVLYDWVTNQKGERLRTFVTRPNGATGKVPAIFFVGWLSCDSMEYPSETPGDGFGVLMRRLIDESGYATVRMDKPGVGESQGDCAKADFQSEMQGFQAAFESIAKYDFIDPARVVVVGMSNGGGFAPLAAREHAVRGYVSISSWGRTWYEHMIDLERRSLLEQGKAPAEITNGVKAFTEFYQLYLMHGMTPGQVLAQHPEWKALWSESADGQYGRPAAFYQQLQGLNLGEVWQNVRVPVLVVRGTQDNIMSRTDAEAIVRNVNQAHPGLAKYEQVEGLTHDAMVDGKFYEPLLKMVLDFTRERMASEAKTAAK